MPSARDDPAWAAENRRRMAAGELYYAFSPDLNAERRRCAVLCDRFNVAATSVSRRNLVEMFNEIVGDTSTLPPPLPPPHDTPAEDDHLLKDFPWVMAPIRMDYGYNVKIGKGVFINFGSVWVDTCTITVGARTLIGPNCSFFSGTHPLDPNLRRGLAGPELGKPITIGEDCWLGGNCTILPGVTIGRGVTVGAGSVVTKDVPDYVCVAGNPARFIKNVDVSQLPPEDGSVVAAAE